VEFIYCQELNIFNVTLINSPFWTVHPTYCDGVVVKGVNIFNPPDSPNTDGVDPDSSWNVLVEDTVIAVGDDMIAVKSGMDQYGIDFGRPSLNITVRNCRFLSGDGISIGSEMSGGVKNITFENIHASNCQMGPYIKTNQERGGYVENVRYINITLEMVPTAIEISMFYGEGLVEEEVYDIYTPLPVINDIVYEGIVGKLVGSAGNLSCMAESPCTNLNMTKVHIESLIKFHCENAEGVADDVSPPSCLSSP
jgi:polygalacturonase